MNLTWYEKNLKKIILFYILFHFMLLFIADRVHYVPKIVTDWENRTGGEVFVTFIKSIWRTAFSASVMIMIFWIWFFFKCGYLIFFFEFMGFFKKEKIIFLITLKALAPIFILIFLKFFFIVFLKKEFISNMSLIYNTEMVGLRFFLNSVEIFKIFEYYLLFKNLREKIGASRVFIVSILAPIFFAEGLFNFTLGKGG